MNRQVQKYKNRERRKKSVRKSVFGTESRPRLSVFRSNKHIYAQLINDTDGKTIVNSSDVKSKSGNGVDSAKKVGESIGKLISKAGVESIVFDRNGYKYHGRVKALADAIREQGIKF